MKTLLQQIHNWIMKTDQRIIIGISGHGAAGKTTFTKSLAERIGPKHVNILHTDPYIISSDIRKNTFIDYEYEAEKYHYKMTACHPGAHHLPSLERDVRMLRDGLHLQTIDTNHLKNTLLRPENLITIVEGMSVAFLPSDCFDLSIYFYTDGETEFKRRSIRDVEERGTSLVYLQQSHAQRRIQYELFMHPYSQHFDIIIHSSSKGLQIERTTFPFT